MLIDNTLYLFTGGWCTPCQAQKKILNEAGMPYIPIEVDTDEGAQIANECGVKTIPTLIYNGKKLVNINTMAKIKEFMGDTV